MKDVKLYINYEYVEIGSETSLPITFQLDDIMNPSQIKNDWSKTISIPSTSINDKVLHHLYKVDRKTTDFNVSSKIPFEITVNEERFKIGYVKFGQIIIQRDGSKFYELNLLGELGNFFYDLGQKKMSELIFDITTTDPITSITNNKLGHVINAQFIKDNWSYVGNSTSNIHTYIKYIPMFQGLYSDFSSDLKLSNAVATTAEPVEIGSEVNEWEIAAFSSRRQKPSISVYHTIKSILKGMNNYQINNTIELIGKNYTDSYVTGNILFQDTDTTYPNKANFSYYSQTRITTDPLLRLTFLNNEQSNGYSFQTPGHTQIIFDKGLGKRNMIASFKSNMTVKFYIYENMSSFPYHKTYTHPSETYIFLSNNGSSIQLSLMRTLDGNEINEYARKNLYFDTTYRLRIPANQTYGILQQQIGGSWIDFNYWEVNDLPINNLRYSVEHYPLMIGLAINGSYNVKDSSGNNISGHDYVFEDNPSSRIELTNTYVSIGYTNKKSIRTDQSTFVDISNIFKPELTQKDFLLEFCRMYGLYISVKNNVVNIQPRNKYYNSNIEEWDSLLDISKEIIIQPIAFEKNKIIVGYKENTECDILKKYKESTSYNYGDAVAITGYEFNDDSIRMLDKNIFKPLALEQIYLYRLGDTSVPVTSILLPVVYKLNGNKREFIESDLSFITYVGTTTLKGPKFGGDDYGNYLIFDDTRKMYDDDKYYYNLNLSNGAMFGNSSIPLFSTHKDTSSFDFRRPVTYYFDNVNLYSEDYTIYSKYWTKFIEDRYSVNTKIMNAYFNLNDSQVRKLTLGEFIYLQGVYWVINKIIDYDLTDYNTTKVELISVNDIENYRSGQSLIAVPVSNTGSVYNLQRNQFQVSNSTSQYDGLIYERGLFYSTTDNVDETSTKLLDYSTTLTENILNNYNSPEHGDNSTSSIHTYHTEEGGFFRYTPYVGNNISLYHFCDSLTKEMSVGTPVSFSFDVRPQADCYVQGYIINMSQTGTLFKSFSVLCLGNVWTRVKVENLTNNVDTENGLLDIIYVGNANVYLDIRRFKIEMNTTSSTYTETPSTPTPIPTGSYNSTIKGLDVNTQYYFRSYCKMGSDYYFGTTLNTTTLNYDLPNVEILNIQAISGTNLVVNSQITYNGGTNVTQCGLVISDATNPVIGTNVHTTDGFDGNGNFQSTVGDILNYNTLYYFRPYAINSRGISYGQEWTATTQANPADAPTISNITYNQNYYNESQFYYTVLTQGTSTVINSGIEIFGGWLNDTYNLGGGVGNRNTIIGSLEIGQTYYIRPFAENSSGKIYGETLEFVNTKMDCTLTGYESNNTYEIYSQYPVGGDLTISVADCYPECYMYFGDQWSTSTTKNSEYSNPYIVRVSGDDTYNYIF